MMDIKKAIEVIEALQKCETADCNENCYECVIMREDLISVYDVAIIALKDKLHNNEHRKNKKFEIIKESARRKRYEIQR